MEKTGKGSKLSSITYELANRILEIGEREGGVTCASVWEIYHCGVEWRAVWFSMGIPIDVIKCS
jgi:hypothetical protein